MLIYAIVKSIPIHPARAGNIECSGVPDYDPKSIQAQTGPAFTQTGAFSKESDL